MHVRTAATVTAEGSPAICICLHVRSVRRILQIPMFTLSLRALRARIAKPSLPMACAGRLPGCRLGRSAGGGFL